MKRVKGFTLVELVIVIIIVSILSIVSVPIYKRYVKRAYATEAKALLGAIKTAENIHYATTGSFVSEGSENNPISQGEFIDVDASKNKFFTSFYVEVQNDAGTHYYAQTNGVGEASGLAMGLRVLETGEILWQEWWNETD